MSGSNARAEFANLYRLTHAAALDHDRAKAELHALVPEDAKEASGHGVRAKRSRSGAIIFEPVETEIVHAALLRERRRAGGGACQGCSMEASNSEVPTSE
jgi:hypothetical protein